MARRVPLLAISAACVAVVLAAPADATKPHVITWQGTKVIQTMKQADAYMPGAPGGLKKAAVARAQRNLAWVKKHPGGCEKPKTTGVYMHKYDSEGYAAGVDGVCSGPLLFFTDYGHGKRHGGHWRLVLSTQDVPSCTFDERYEMPSAMVGSTCADDAKGKDVPYHQK